MAPAARARVRRAGSIDAAAEEDVGEPGRCRRVGSRAAGAASSAPATRTRVPAAAPASATAAGSNPGCDGDRSARRPGPAHDRQARPPDAAAGSTASRPPPVTAEGRRHRRPGGGQPGEGELDTLAVAGGARGGHDGGDPGRHRDAVGPTAGARRGRSARSGAGCPGTGGGRAPGAAGSRGTTASPASHRAIDRPGGLGGREQHGHGLGLVVRRHRRLPYFVRVIALRVTTPGIVGEDLP